MANSGKGNLSETENSSRFDIRIPTLFKKLAIGVCVVLLGAGIIWLVSWIINEVDRGSSVSGGGGANTSGGVHASTSSSTPPPPNTGAPPPPPPPNTGAAETPPTPADCVGGWSTCDASCSKTYNVTSEAVGTGAACPVATGSTADCDPGEGACPASALALIEEVIDSTFDPSLCNSNTAVSNITEMPCSNDFNRFLIYWTEQIEQCNSGSTPPCEGLTYSVVYNDYLTSGTPGSCSEDSILHGIIQNSLEMCQSVDQDDPCLISDMSDNDKRACCRIQEEWDGTTLAYSAVIVDGCVNLSPSCTRDNINSQANRDTCDRWNEEQGRQNPPPTTPDEEANPSAGDSQCNISTVPDAMNMLLESGVNCDLTMTDPPLINLNADCSPRCLDALKNIQNCASEIESYVYPQWVYENEEEALRENITRCMDKLSTVAATP